MNVTRIVLPGFNALTDTNPDHFSLYSDIDNVLIKRKQTGTATIADGNPNILTIPHNLGYIPFFMVYYLDETTSKWVILNNQYNLFSVPQQICAIDTANLYIYNFGGHSSHQLQIAYDIFYDNMNDTTAPSITESKDVFKVARPSIDASLSKNPNDYIMHSDLNNFKILKQGAIDIECKNLTTITIPHGANVQAPYKYFLYIRSPFDSKVFLMGGSSQVNTFDNGSTFTDSSMDATNLYIHKTLFTSTEVFKFRWIIYGSGKDNSVDNTKPVIAIAKTGHNAKSETNPDNFNFHSKYPTLKYYFSSVYSLTASSETVITIPHNLGYVPFFIGFVQDLAGIILNGYAIMPYYFSRSSIPLPLRDIAAYMYADETNIYLKAHFQTHSGGPFIFNFYYKIFKNNLNM